MILVTGGAGFIGANFVLDWVANVTSDSYRDWVAKHYAS